MKGFDKRWADFPDYILGITKEIWEDRGLGGKMRDYYAPEVIVRTPGGISIGEPASTAATMSTLVEFPDRQLLGEDVIWSGRPETGMLSSHRIVSTVTHTGNGGFGPATGKTITYRAIADCFAKDNMISDEWLVRDNGAIVRQMGYDPKDWARGKVEAGMATPFTPQMDVKGPYFGNGNDNPWGQAYVDLFSRMMSADFSVVPEQYDRACHLAYPGGVSAHGWGAADGFWLGLRAAFPSAICEVHHVIGLEEPLLPPRAALRFSLTGTHDGWGSFGAPSGAPVHVMGIAHAEFGPRGLRREYVLFDETAIWMQILSHTG
jgi:hypothetical protein